MSVLFSTAPMLILLDSYGYFTMCLMESVAEKKKDKEIGRPQLRWYVLSDL